MAQSYLDPMSHHQTQSQYPTSPRSVNYVSAGSDSAVPRSEQETVAATQKTGKRSNVKAKLRKVFFSAKKNLQMAAHLCRPGSSDSAASSSVDTLNRAGSRLSMHSRPTLRPRESTLTICLTKPSYKGTNVRLSIHQGPPVPEAKQTFLLDGVDSPESGSVRDKRKSTRFHHPVVNAMIADHGTPMASSSLLPSSQRSFQNSDQQAGSVAPGTPTTIATVDFENQVNPKRVFRHSHAVSNGESYDTFKDVMDGVRAKSPPRAAAAKLQSTPPTLPFLPLQAGLQIDDDEISPLEQPDTEIPEKHVPAAVMLGAPVAPHPSGLVPGSVLPVPLPKPRTTAPRPHTTGELFAGAGLLPYVPYNPRFNPYDATPSPSIPPVSQKPSANDLAVAFAEAEAAEELMRHKRHTTLYADVESGSLPLHTPKSIVATPAVTHSVKRKTVPTPVAAKPTAKALEPKRVRISKPLPPLPAPHSPRRFTQMVAPATLPMNEHGYPVLAESKKKQKKSEKKEESAKLGRKRTARAVEKVLQKLML